MRKYGIFLGILLIALLALPVFAAPAGTLTVGQTVTVNAIPNGQVDYTFTPTESGDYAVCLEETGANFEGWACLDGDTKLPERYYWVAGWEGKVFSLTAGKTYTIRITHDTGFGGTLARKMRLEKVTATTTLSLQNDYSENYPGEVVWVDPVLSHPGAVSGNFQWSSSNPAVAYIEDTGSIHAAVMPVAPGTTTITLTVDGLTASCEFVVVDFPAIPIGGSLDFQLHTSDRRVFSITPTETGRYAIWHKQQEGGLVVTEAGIGDHFSGGGGNGGGVIYTLRAGVTYHAYYNAGHAGEDLIVEDTVYAEKVRPVESVTLRGEPGALPVGFRFVLEAVADPIYGVTEGVQWSCSDPDVLLLEHMDPYDGRCEAVVLKEGTATVTVTIGGVSASWEYGIPNVPEWQPDPSVPLWSLGTTTTMPLAKEASTENAFCAPEDGYYRFTLQADQETFVTLHQNYSSGEDTAWGHVGIAAGGEVTMDVYLHKDRYYQIQNSGSFDGGGTLTGKVERLQITGKPVERIEVTASPTYEFKDDDYGGLVDAYYAFNPFRAGNIPSLQVSVYYTDGTSAVLTQDQLTWDVRSELGLPGCTWNGIPVELCLLNEADAPTDSVWITAPRNIAARLRFMGVAVEFTMVMTPGHNHEMVFQPVVDPTPQAPGMAEHYLCSICHKRYGDAEGMFRFYNERDLILEHKNEFIVDQNQAQDIVQQAKPGENVNLPVPEGMTHVVLPPAALQEIVNKENTLEFGLENAIVQVDPAALAAILSQGGNTEVTLQVQQVAAQALNASQQQALENRDVVCVLSAKVLCGENSIHDFGGGQVTLQIPFAPEPGMGYQVIYVADDGTVTVIPSTYADGFMRFSTGHFSEYAIVKDPEAPPVRPAEDPAGSLVWLIPVIVVAAVGAAAGLLIWKRRKK